MARSHVVITKQQFLSMMPRKRFEFPDYNSDWKRKNGDWQQTSTNVKEYCYIIPLNSGVCIKVYSSIERDTDLSRGRGKDSIKFVVARESDLRPIRSRFTHTYRIDTWRENFKKNMTKVLSSLGNDMKCSCGGQFCLISTNDGSRNFLSCENYKKNGCRGKTLKAVVS